jgi:hypothetical protein
VRQNEIKVGEGILTVDFAYSQNLHGVAAMDRLRQDTLELR